MLASIFSPSSPPLLTFRPLSPPSLTHPPLYPHSMSAADDPIATDQGTSCLCSRSSSPHWICLPPLRPDAFVPGPDTLATFGIWPDPPTGIQIWSDLVVAATRRSQCCCGHHLPGRGRHRHSPGLVVVELPTGTGSLVC